MIPYIKLLLVFAFVSFVQESQALETKIRGELVEVEKGYSSTSVNTAVFRQSSLVSNDTLQYISFYDSDGNVVVGKRRLGTKDWELKKTEFKGNIKDGHNIISIGLDGDGILHMAFDHHGSPLHYTRTVEPVSLEFEGLQPMTGRNEENVTYPEFHSMANGNLIFVYREGSSGNGNMVMNRFSHETKTWETLHENLIDGEGERNAYWQMFADPEGTIHLSWVWRETWLVETNHDMCYARSRDGGKTWEKSDGTQYKLPITIETAEVAYAIPQNSELINQTSMTADSRGNPYIATYWRDGGSEVPQYRLVWNDGNEWKMSQVGNRTFPFSLSGGGTKMIPISRPRVVSDGKQAYYIFRDQERGSVVSLAYTSNLKTGEWEIIDLTDFPVDAWEPSYDPNLWNNKNKLNIYVQRSHQGDGEKLSENEETESMVYVLEINSDM